MLNNLTEDLQNYIVERIKELPKNIKGLIVFDIDDTLLKADPSVIKIYKTEPGKAEIGLTTDEFAKDPDAQDPSKQDWFDYRDFKDPDKIYNSIVSGTPLIKNLKIMDDYINAGYDFCFLTARGCEEAVKDALKDFLKFKDKNGVMSELKNEFKETLSHAVNDEYKKYPGKNVAEKKANVLKHLCEVYNKVVFVDDDKRNIEMIKKLNIKNLTAIQANKE